MTARYVSIVAVHEIEKHRILAWLGAATVTVPYVPSPETPTDFLSLLGRAPEALDFGSMASVRNMFALVLGRSPINAHEVFHYLGVEPMALAATLAQKSEFAVEVEGPVSLVGHASANRFPGDPTDRLRRWMTATFPLAAATRQTVLESAGWRALTAAFWGDPAVQAGLAAAGGPDAARLGRHARKCLDLGTGPLGNAAVGWPQAIGGRGLCVGVPRGGPEASGPPVRPMQHVRSTKGLSRQLTAPQVCEPDPQIVLKVSLPAGTYRLSLTGRYRALDGSARIHERAQIFFDFGDGFAEDRSVTLPVRDGVLSVQALLRLDAPVVRLRFDPADHPCNFEIDTFTVAAAAASRGVAA